MKPIPPATVMIRTLAISLALGAALFSAISLERANARALRALDDEYVVRVEFAGPVFLLLLSGVLYLVSGIIGRKSN